MSTDSAKEVSNPIDPTSPERRRHLRFPFTASIEAIETKSGLRITGRVGDLGLGGCYVDAISPFPVGADAKIRISRGKESFEAQARVIYSQIGMGMGLAFVSAQPQQVRLFQRWLLEISGKAPRTEETSVGEPPEEAKGTLEEGTDYVLNELLITLIRKGILTDAEGKAMLRKLHT